MNKLFEQIGFAMTSMAAVIFVLVLTLLGLLMFTHTLFFDVLPPTITGWERYLASWTLALAWEFSLLTTTVNTQFLNRRIPLVAAIASGIIVLFFIEAFSFDQPMVELLKRWLVGCIIAFVNFTYTELFYAKWQDQNRKKTLDEKVTELEQVIDRKSSELNVAQDHLTIANADIDRMVEYVTELEAFKKRELDSRKCSFCQTILPSLYHLASHRPNCEMNPKRSHKKSVLESVVQ